jgi:hypothetical protein
MTANQFTVEDDRYRDEPPVRSTNWLKGCLLGCLAVVVVLLIVGTVAAIYIARNWKGWVASSMSMGIKQGIDATDLPAEEKAQIKVEVDRGVELFRDGRMSGEQAAMLVQKAMNSPLMTAIVTTAVEKKYLDRSGLNDEEKAAARVTLPRFVRGMIDEKIPQQAQDAAFRHVGEKQPNEQWKFREKLSDEDLRAFLTEAKKAADEAEIPEQPQAVDPSEEVKRIIDEAMAGPPADAAPPLEIPSLPETPPEPEATDL